MSLTSVLHSWRKWIRFSVVIIYIVLLVIAVPLCIWELEREGAPDHVQAWFVAGMFVLMALPISFWGILQHILNYTTPHMQRYIIRILWMVPIYALNAWFALRFPAAAIYLDTLRECYEAYVIYNFMAYLLSFLNHEYPELDLQLEGKPPVKHIFPLCLLPPCRSSPKFIHRCKHGVLQYTVVRPTMTIIALICEICGKYQEGDFNFTTAWSYIVIINNMSQILAMYCLVLFYKAFKEELQPLKPVPKFLCVKAVVFLSFWQAVIIAALAKLGAIPTNGPWMYYNNIKEVATGLQDFIICIEMFLAAIAHYFSFSHKPFINPTAEQQNCCISFLSMWNVKDVTQDVVEHARYIGRGMKKTISQGKKLVNGAGNERTPLLSDRDSQATSGGGVMLQAVESSKAQESASLASTITYDDTDSYGGDSLRGDHYSTFVNKATTSGSLVNYAEFVSDAGSQHASAQNKSRSHSGEGLDNISIQDMNADLNSGAQDNNVNNEQAVDNNIHKNGSHLQIRVVAEINVNNSNQTVGPDHINLDNYYSHSINSHSQTSSDLSVKESHEDSLESLPREKDIVSVLSKEENGTS